MQLFFISLKAKIIILSWVTDLDVISILYNFFLLWTLKNFNFTFICSSHKAPHSWNIVNIDCLWFLLLLWSVVVYNRAIRYLQKFPFSVFDIQISVYRFGTTWANNDRIFLKFPSISFNLLFFPPSSHPWFPFTCISEAFFPLQTHPFTLPEQSSAE